MVPGWMNAEQRAKEVNNFLQGMVPNVNVRRGRRANDADLEMHVVGRSRRSKGDKKLPKSVIKLKDLHHMLRIIF